MDYIETNLRIVWYWRWGAFYLLTFDNGERAFVSIDKSVNEREYCTVWNYYNADYEETYHADKDGKLMSFLMSYDEIKKQTENNK